MDPSFVKRAHAKSLVIHAARSLGGTDCQIMRTVIVPSALAWTFASLSPSIQSLGTLNAADMMVALISLGVIGIVMALGIRQVEMRLLRWRPEYRERA